MSFWTWLCGTEENKSLYDIAEFDEYGRRSTIATKATQQGRGDIRPAEGTQNEALPKEKSLKDSKHIDDYDEADLDLDDEDDDIDNDDEIYEESDDESEGYPSIGSIDERETPQISLLYIGIYVSTFLLLGGIVAAYLAVGAVFFKPIEANAEDQSFNTLKKTRAGLYNAMKAAAETLKDPKAWTEKASVELVSYEDNLDKVYRKRLGGNAQTEANNTKFKKDIIWTIYGSTVFCASVITSIGWGNIVPKTEIGRLSCVIYATFGIPLLFSFATLLSTMISRLAEEVWLASAACIRLVRGKKKQPKLNKTLNRISSIDSLVILKYLQQNENRKPDEADYCFNSTQFDKGDGLWEKPDALTHENNLARVSHLKSIIKSMIQVADDPTGDVWIRSRQAMTREDVHPLSICLSLLNRRDLQKCMRYAGVTASNIDPHWQSGSKITIDRQDTISRTSDCCEPFDTSIGSAYTSRAGLLSSASDLPQCQNSSSYEKNPLTYCTDISSYRFDKRQSDIFTDKSSCCFDERQSKSFTGKAPSGLDKRKSDRFTDRSSCCFDKRQSDRFTDKSSCCFDKRQSNSLSYNSSSCVGERQSNSYNNESSYSFDKGKSKSFTDTSSYCFDKRQSDSYIDTSYPYYNDMIPDNYSYKPSYCVEKRQCGGNNDESPYYIDRRNSFGYNDESSFHFDNKHSDRSTYILSHHLDQKHSTGWADKYPEIETLSCYETQMHNLPLAISFNSQRIIVGRPSQSNHSRRDAAPRDRCPREYELQSNVHRMGGYEHSSIRNVKSTSLHRESICHDHMNTDLRDSPGAFPGNNLLKSNDHKNKSVCQGTPCAYSAIDYTDQFSCHSINKDHLPDTSNCGHFSEATSGGTILYQSQRMKSEPIYADQLELKHGDRSLSHDCKNLSDSIRRPMSVINNVISAQRMDVDWCDKDKHHLPLETMMGENIEKQYGSADLVLLNGRQSNKVNYQLNKKGNPRQNFTGIAPHGPAYKMSSEQESQFERQKDAKPYEYYESRGQRKTIERMRQTDGDDDTFNIVQLIDGRPKCHRKRHRGRTGRSKLDKNWNKTEDDERGDKKYINDGSGVSGDSDGDDAEDVGRRVPFIIYLILVGLDVMIGMFMFRGLTEGKKLTDSLYFTVVMLTTIGFGDIVPQEEYYLSLVLYGFLSLALANFVTNKVIESILDTIDSVNSLADPNYDDDYY